MDRPPSTSGLKGSGEWALPQKKGEFGPSPAAPLLRHWRSTLLGRSGTVRASGKMRSSASATPPQFLRSFSSPSQLVHQRRFQESRACSFSNPACGTGGRTTATESGRTCSCYAPWQRVGGVWVLCQLKEVRSNLGGQHLTRESKAPAHCSSHTAQRPCRKKLPSLGLCLKVQDSFLRAP